MKVSVTVFLVLTPLAAFGQKKEIVELQRLASRDSS
jgi:hypothetical protein